jgi:hypothetical protein
MLNNHSLKICCLAGGLIRGYIDCLQQSKSVLVLASLLSKGLKIIVELVLALLKESIFC